VVHDKSELDIGAEFILGSVDGVDGLEGPVGLCGVGELFAVAICYQGEHVG